MTLSQLLAYELGSGRLVPTVAAVLGLAGTAAGALATVRAARIHGGRARTPSMLALSLGALAAVVGGLHAASAAGGLGTGNGLAGAVVAIVLGAVAVLLGGLGLRRAAVRSSA